MTVPRRRKKTRRLRGSRLHGFGKQRQHRKSGRKGGSGKSGRHKHKWTWTVAKSPNYFGRGRRGFRGSGKEHRIINLSEVEQRLNEFLEEGAAVESKGGEIELDLIKAGYEKVLGGGDLSTPMTIKCRSFSTRAADKIERAGGKALRVD